MKQTKKGGFTLPGEAGCEALTLELADRWGADVIRDSDGTELSDEILDAGYSIYSTICLIRDHNEWAREHPDCLQQTFLTTRPCLAGEGPLSVALLADFFDEQFRVNDGETARRYWQVWDRTEGTLLDAGAWHWQPGTGCVVVDHPTPYHSYTVSFLAYRIWEEISMYNHLTNHWDKEHLMPIDPRRPEARAFLTDWLRNWCETHPHTTVVRFTSLFYNFVWIWGSDERNRSLFTDWGSYDFTVSEQALADFAAEYGYELTAEDFINKGNFQVTHQPPTAHKRDYMAFTQRFVASYGRTLVDLVHQYGKKAYVFYDDSWIGVEPYGPYFPSIGFDGIIKCVFSGYEVRMCSGVPAQVHELRLHPYLFPVGLGGAPTFTEGGDPTRDARAYWNHVRRALLRAPIDRIGLGGYLHLVKDFPDFVQYIADLADEFREVRDLHAAGEVYTMPLTVAVLHSWGGLRPWTLSGHFHETYMHDLIHINEALSGLPVETRFLSFEDVKAGKLEGVDVVINAGRAGTAWSGGDAWQDAALVTALSAWVAQGGVLIGVNRAHRRAGLGRLFPDGPRPRRGRGHRRPCLSRPLARAGRPRGGPDPRGRHPLHPRPPLPDGRRDPRPGRTGRLPGHCHPHLRPRPWHISGRLCLQPRKRPDAAQPDALGHRDRQQPCPVPDRQCGLRMCLVPGCPPPCGHQQHRTSTDHRHPHTGGRCAG